MRCVSQVNIINAMKNVDDSKLDVLQNIEFAIIEVYRADPSVLDVDAKDAVDALVRHYHAEEVQHAPPARRVGERAERVFLSVQSICEWRLGRSAMADETEGPAGMPVAELVKALRKIQKSIPFWTSGGGRRGYLNFIGQFLP